MSTSTTHTHTQREKGGKGVEEDDQHELELEDVHLDGGVTAHRPLRRCGPRGRPPPRPLPHDASHRLHLGGGEARITVELLDPDTEQLESTMI
jgi:hypothetical protein